MHCSASWAALLGALLVGSALVACGSAGPDPATLPARPARAGPLRPGQRPGPGVTRRRSRGAARGPGPPTGGVAHGLGPALLRGAVRPYELLLARLILVGGCDLAMALLASLALLAGGASHECGGQGNSNVKELLRTRNPQGSG